MNLIANAVKFGYENSPVTVNLEDMGERVRITVHDRGDPIAAKDMHNIFTFFSSGTKNPKDAEKKGWGLGLSLIKSIAKHHGGEAIIESSAETGTTIGMTLKKDFHRPGDTLSVLI